MERRFVLVSKDALRKELLKSSSRGVYFVSYNPQGSPGNTITWSNVLQEACVFASELEAWDKAYHIWGLSYALKNYSVMADWT